jgi:hypothetical protein
MIGERGGERVKHMSSKPEVPFGIAKNGIKLAKGWVSPSVAPSEPAILKMDLIKLTSVQGGTEAVDTTSVHICLVLVPSTVNLVEVAKHKPSSPNGGLLGNQLGEEVVFSICGRRPVDGGDSEIAVGVDDVHGG